MRRLDRVFYRGSINATAAFAGHIAGRSGVRCVIDLDRVPLAESATVDDLSFGEDYELLAALPPQVAGYHEIGRCEEGNGVELRLGGKLIELSGWDHFRLQ